MPVSFADHITLLTHVLDRRAEAIDGIERQLLNVQHKDTGRRRDRDELESRLGACFADASAPRALLAVQGQLAAAHRGDGFESVRREANAPHIDPVELLVRAYDHWDSTRWPGRN